MKVIISGSDGSHIAVSTGTDRRPCEVEDGDEYAINLALDDSAYGARECHGLTPAEARTLGAALIAASEQESF